MEEGNESYNYIHLTIFPISWILSYVLGQTFFENSLYHSSMNKKWALLCRTLFLFTFVLCLSLLELLLFEMLDFFPTSFRKFAWTVTLGLLSMLLNIFIPGVLSFSVSLHHGNSFKLSSIIGAFCIMLFQTILCLIGVFMVPTSDNDDINEINKSNDVPSTILIYLAKTLIIDIQQSVSHLTVLGCIIAAGIAGYATVSFPLEYLTLTRMNIDKSLLIKKENSLNHLLISIVQEKKKILVNSKTNIECISRENSMINFQDFYKVDNDNINNESVADKLISDAIKWGSNILNNLVEIKSEKLPIYNNNIINKKSSSISLSNSTINFNSIKNEEKLQKKNNKYLYKMEKLAKEKYIEHTNLMELYEITQNKQTKWGRLLSISAWLFTIWGSFRLLYGMWHVCKYFIWNIRLILGYSIKATNKYEVVEGRFGSVQEQDFVSIILQSLSNAGLSVPYHYVKAWSHLVNLICVVIIALMQIRGFLVASTQMSKFGFISTSSEHSALLLAELAGTYFIACVVLLRAQLPFKYRKGVSISLGENLPFNFYFWLFDAVFVSTCIITGFILYREQRRKFQSYTNEKDKNNCFNLKDTKTNQM